MSKNPFRPVDTAEPVKVRVEAAKVGEAVTTNPAAAVIVPAIVVDQKQGTVSVFDKVKAYYHTLIVAIGAILIAVNQFTPLLDFLPGDSKSAVTVGIAFLTGLVNFLKSNEVWVQKLPS